MRWKLIIPGIAGVLSAGVAFASNSTTQTLALLASEGQKQAVSTPTGGINIVLVGAAAAFVVWYLNKSK